MGSSKKQDSTLFFGGIPTAADVKKLREQWPETEMRVGDVMNYVEIEEVLHVSRQSSRFRTVTNKWRKEVKDAANIIIGPVDGVAAFKVLSEPEKLGLGIMRLRESGRKARKAIDIFTRTDVKQLTEEERKRLDHGQRVSGAILASAQLRKNAPVLPEV